MTEYLDLIMFAALMVAILSGFPVSFSIAGVAVAFAYLGWMLGIMDVSLLGALGQRAFGLLTNTVLIAIPVFVLMGAILEKSRIAEELLDTMGRSFGQLRGGLGISVVLVGALLAASTGIVGATVVAMGMIALPTMLRAGYNPALSAGIVCTAGTLGQIIPPSTLLIILADVMSNAFQQAQYEQGKFSVEALSVGQFFAAAMILYPRWYDPFTDRLCGIETALDAFEARTRAWREDHRGWVAGDVALRKQGSWDRGERE